jgi:hypothetical protein
MKIRRAVVAGLVGGVVATAVIALAGWSSRSDGDLSALFGAVISGRDDWLGWIAGSAVQLVVAIVAALMYAAVFEWVTRRSGALVGLAIAAAHVVVAGLMVGFVPAKAVIADGLTPPGAFLEYRGGLAIVAFICAHLAFGAIVGALYGKPRHTVAAAERVWLDVSKGAS